MPAIVAAIFVGTVATLVSDWLDLGADRQFWAVTVSSFVGGYLVGGWVRPRGR